MGKYDALTDNEKAEIYTQGMTYLIENNEELAGLIESTTIAKEPIVDEMFHPEGWKAEHWKWFLERELEEQENEEQFYE